MKTIEEGSKLKMTVKEERRFKQLVHFILWYHKSRWNVIPCLTKLHTIIWKLDVYSFRHFGKSMSGTEFYIKREFLIHPSLYRILDNLIEEEVLRISTSNP